MTPRYSQLQRRRSTGAGLLPLALTFLILLIDSRASAFSTPTSRHVSRKSSLLSAAEDRIEIPLLDVAEDAEMIIPLPSSHLPQELTTCNVYGMKLTVPLYQKIVDHAVENSNNMLGHVAYKPDKDSLVGAIGCTAQVLLNVPASQADLVMEDSETPQEEKALASPKTILCRGSYRFIVRKVIQSIPYAVAVVEELQDDNTSEDSIRESRALAAETDDDDDDDNEYAELSPSDLIRRTLVATQAYLDQQLELASKPVQLSPLEKSILEDQGIMSRQQIAANAKRQAAEESMAILQVFQTELVDTFVQPNERYFALAFLAAELVNLDNAVRRTLLRQTNSLERLRYVCAKTEEAVGMLRARKLAKSITDDTDEASKDLQVGTPTLPPWAKSIRKGMKVEYYWNEEFEWCKGQVVEDPVMVVDELIVTVHFEDDDTTHRLPFAPDEKARWRPAN